MTALVTLRCDAAIPGGCTAKAAASPYETASSLRKLAAEKFGWKSVIFKHTYPVIYRDGKEYERTQGQRHDFCKAHAHLIPKPANRTVRHLTYDYRDTQEA